MGEEQNKKVEEQKTLTQEEKDLAAQKQLSQDYDNLIADTNAVYDGQIKSVADLVSAAETEIQQKKEQDVNYRRREDAYQYINGIGDALSGIVNVVGAVKGAPSATLTQTSNPIMQKAEEARKARKLEVEEMKKRLDEMKSRERDLRGAKDLKEAELNAEKAKELRTLKAQQDTLEREAKYKERKLAVDEKNAETARINAEKGKGTTSTTKPKYVTIQQPDGTTTQMDVSAYKDFWGDYQRVLDAAIADGTSGLSEDEIKAYNDAVKLAKVDNKKALNEFLRTHTPRQAVVDRMKSVTSITSNYP